MAVSRTAPVAAWRVQEGDLLPSGAIVTSVHRDPSHAKVRIGWSNGASLTVSGDRHVAIVVPDRTATACIRGAQRARQLLHAG